MEIRKLVDPFVCDCDMNQAVTENRRPLVSAFPGRAFGLVRFVSIFFFLPTLHLNSHVNGGMTVKVQAHGPPKLDVIQ